LLQGVAYFKGIPSIAPRELSGDQRYSYLDAAFKIGNKPCWTVYIQERDRNIWISILETLDDKDSEAYLIHGPFSTDDTPKGYEVSSAIRRLISDLYRRKVSYIKMGPFHTLVDPLAIMLYKMGFGASIDEEGVTKNLELVLHNHKRIPELFGLAMRDQVSGQEVVLKIQRDDGHIAEESLAPYILPPSELPAYDKDLFSIVKQAVPKGSLILDIGAGAGRHSLALQEYGYKVVAIDNQETMVSLCRKRGVHDARIMDIRNMTRLEERFSAFLLLGNNLGLAGNVDDTYRLFHNLKFLGKPGAIMIGTIKDPTYNPPSYHLEYHALNSARGKYMGEVRLRIIYKERFSPWFNLLFMPRDLVMQIADETDWRLIKEIKQGTPEAPPPGMLAFAFSKN